MMRLSLNVPPSPGAICGPSGRPPEDAATWGSTPPTLEQMCRPELQALRIQPRRSRLVLFFSHATRESPLLFPQAMHGACPVRAGRKRIAQRFYWATPVPTEPVATRRPRRRKVT